MHLFDRYQYYKINCNAWFYIWQIYERLVISFIVTWRHFYSVVEPANIATGLSPPVLIVIWYFAPSCLADIWLILQRGVLNQPSQRPTCRHAIPCLPLLHFNPIMIRPFDDDAITIQTVHKEPNIPNILWAHKCNLCHASKQPPILARPSPLCPKGATTPAFPVQSTFTLSSILISCPTPQHPTIQSLLYSLTSSNLKVTFWEISFLGGIWSGSSSN